MPTYDTLQKKPNKAEQAAKWWKNLSEESQRHQHSISEHAGTMSFERFAKSEKVVRDHWVKTMNCPAKVNPCWGLLDDTKRN